MKSNRDRVRDTLLPTLLLLPVLAAPQASAQEAGAREPLRHARIAQPTARILNLPDEQASEVMRPRKGSLVAVYREVGDWLEVEVPGGYAVWVFGRFLRETDEADVYEVVRNGVNVRPEPSRDVANYPLRQKLHAGDRVRVIDRADSKKPLAEDWVRVWSPAGIRAWLRADRTESLSPDEVGAAAWKRALEALPPPSERGPAGGSGEGSEPGASDASDTPESAEGSEQESFDSLLETAWKLMATERAKATPDFSLVRAAFDRARAVAPTGAQAVRAGQGLDALVALEEASALKAELELERGRRAQEAISRQKEIWERGRAKDPLGGVFLSRGALERVSGTDGTPRYFVRFGGKLTSELVCVSGRYDLDLFAGYRIGAKGMVLRAADAAEDDPPRIEVTRLEVLSRR